MALLEIPLCFIVFPLLAALIAAGGTATKIGAALLAAIAAFLGDVLCTGVVQYFGGLIGGVAGGTLALLVIAASTGKTCPRCKSRIPSGATRCPKCQTELREQPKEHWAGPDKRLPASINDQRAPGTALPPKKCPDCAEEVKGEARKCRFCGFLFTETVPPSESGQSPVELLAPIAVDTGEKSWETFHFPHGQCRATEALPPEKGSLWPIAIAIIVIVLVLAAVAFSLQPRH